MQWSICWPSSLIDAILFLICSQKVGWADSSFKVHFFFWIKNVEGGEADATCLLKLFKRTHFHIPRAAATWSGLFCSQNMQCWKHVRLYLDQYTAKNSQIDYNSYQIITHIQFNSFENVIFTSKGEFKKIAF